MLQLLQQHRKICIILACSDIRHNPNDANPPSLLIVEPPYIASTIHLFSSISLHRKTLFELLLRTTALSMLKLLGPWRLYYTTHMGFNAQSLCTTSHTHHISTQTSSVCADFGVTRVSKHASEATTISSVFTSTSVANLIFDVNSL